MNIALVGYGKMGKAIEEIALQRGHKVLLKIDLDNQADLNKENLSKIDVAIEFTGPESAPNNLKTCFDAATPVVCGSTGWLEHFDEMKDYCKKKNAAFVYASNFSVGVNIFFAVNERLAELMEKHDEYNLTVTEIHHTAKKDAPSGTAITIAEQILEKISRKSRWVNHISDNNEDLEILSERIDPAPGTHIVAYTSPIDDIEIKHTAHNRKGFATGAVLAAEFLKDKKGIYSMKEVLGI